MAKLPLGFCLISDGQAEAKWKFYSDDKTTENIFINSFHFYSFLSETATFANHSPQYTHLSNCALPPAKQDNLADPVGAVGLAFLA